MGFARLLDILKQAQARYPRFARRLHEAEALGRWESAVGPQIARHSRAVRVIDGVLFVEVDHPIWKTELHHRKRQILEILNTGKPASAGRAALEPAQEALLDIRFVDGRPG